MCVQFVFRTTSVASSFFSFFSLLFSLDLPVGWDNFGGKGHRLYSLGLSSLICAKTAEPIECRLGCRLWWVNGSTNSIVYPGGANVLSWTGPFTAHGNYDWKVRLRWRWSLVSIYFDHLLLLGPIAVLHTYTVSQKTSHLWLAITLTCMNGFWYFLAEMLPIK